MINAPRWARKEYMKMIVSEKELCKSNEADSSFSKRLGKAIIALLVIAAVLIAALAGAWAMFGTQLTAAMTIEKLDDHLWSMEYTSSLTHGNTAARKPAYRYHTCGRHACYSPLEYNLPEASQQSD